MRVRCGAASAKSPRLRPLPQIPSFEPRAGMDADDVDVDGQVVRAGDWAAQCVIQAG